MPLFHVQDSDRPGYVVAESFAEALEKWRFAVKDENDGEPGEEPDGVAMICEDSDLIVDFVWRDGAATTQKEHQHDWRKAFDGTEVCSCGSWR